MVDTYGRWIYDPNTPKEKRCDMDFVANTILNTCGYTPKYVSIETLSERVFAAIEDDIEVYDDLGNLDKSLLLSEIRDRKPFSDFDYEDDTIDPAVIINQLADIRNSFTDDSPFAKNIRKTLARAELLITRGIETGAYDRKEN